MFPRLLLFVALVAGILFSIDRLPMAGFRGKGLVLAFAPSSPPVASKSKSVFAKIVPAKTDAPPTRRTWGNVASLADHFARHGVDFHAKDADQYARMAWEFGDSPAAWRADWIRRGMPWSSVAQPAPVGWNAAKQMRGRTRATPK